MSSFICPITQARFVHPVVAPSGHTFERQAIVEWLSNHTTCPITRQPLEVGDLVPNRALKSLMEEEEEKSKAPPAPPAPEPPSAPVVELEAPTITPVAGVGDCFRVVVPDVKDVGDLPPINLVFVVDSSGSMNASATVKGSVEATNLSNLDLVCHAAETIAHTLREGVDHYGVVEYSHAASVVLPLTLMDGRPETMMDVKKEVETIDAGGQTNLFDGLRSALGMFSGAPPAAADVVFLLTDGCANVEPPRGTVAATKRLIAARDSGRPLVIYTFGFGTNQDEKQLASIAELTAEAGGRYVFASDPGMLVTTISHALAGAITYRYDLIPKRMPGARAGSTVYVRGLDPMLEEKEEVELPEEEVSRRAMATMIGKLLTCNRFGLQKEESTNLLREAAGQLVGDDEESLDQFVQAISREDWWTAWGRRFAMSLGAAIKQRTGHSFKDSCCRRFVGEGYASVVETVEQTFSSLPPPKPKRDTFDYAKWGGGYGGYGSGGHSPPPTPSPIDMSAYVDMDGGCIYTATAVHTSRDGIKCAGDVRPGDFLLSVTNAGNAIYVPVMAVATTTAPAGSLFSVDDVCVTAYHPLCQYKEDMFGVESELGHWVFPVDAGFKVIAAKDDVRATERRQVVSFVMPVGIVGVLTGRRARICAAALGHGCVTGDRVLAHSFFGNRAAVMCALAGVHLDADSGHHVVKGMVRRGRGGEVVGFV